VGVALGLGEADAEGLADGDGDADPSGEGPDTDGEGEPLVLTIGDGEVVSTGQVELGVGNGLRLAVGLIDGSVPPVEYEGGVYDAVALGEGEGLGDGEGFCALGIRSMASRASLARSSGRGVYPGGASVWPVVTA